MIGATDDDDDVGFAWSGRWRRRDLRGRSINDGKFSSTDMVRLDSLSPGAALNDQRNLAALTILSVVTRADKRETKATAKQPPLLKLFYQESDSNERLRVSDWIVQRLYNYAVKKTVEL